MIIWINKMLTLQNKILSGLVRCPDLCAGGEMYIYEFIYYYIYEFYHIYIIIQWIEWRYLYLHTVPIVIYDTVPIILQVRYSYFNMVNEFTYDTSAKNVTITYVYFLTVRYLSRIWANDNTEMVFEYEWNQSKLLLFLTWSF